MCNTTTQQLPTLRVSSDVVLPDNTQWKNRFEINSASSDRVYVVAQNKNAGYWGCSCPGWRIHRKCKHLAALGLPANQQPFEVTFQKA